MGALQTDDGLRLYYKDWRIKPWVTAQRECVGGPGVASHPVRRPCRSTATFLGMSKLLLPVVVGSIVTTSQVDAQQIRVQNLFPQRLLQTERFFKPVRINNMLAIGDGPVKTFPLRGIKDAPPYLHDERLLTLDDTVEFFNLVLGTKLSHQEKQDLVAFLRTL